MDSDSFVYSFFLIFACAGILATLALYTRQPLIVMYIVTGMILGPSGTALIDNPQLISSVAKFGIIFLLFLLGLDMQPARLLNMFRSALLVGITTSIIFFIIGVAIAYSFGYPLMETIIIGTAMMFSSTIIGIKLLPTTILHHRHTGALIVSLLLIQDLIAIIVLLVIAGGFLEFGGVSKVIRVLISLPILCGISWLFVKFILLRLLEKFDVFHEYIFLMAVGWCLGLAVISEQAGLSLEIGAFIAGITIANSPMAMYIADHLKPLRDFFLVLFFFSVGASFHIDRSVSAVFRVAVNRALYAKLTTKSASDAVAATLTARCRLTHLSQRTQTLVGLAWIGLPLRNRARSSANPWALS